MKKVIFTFSVIFVLAAMSFISCKKDGNGAAINPIAIIPIVSDTAKTLTANFDGSPFSATLFSHELLDSIHVFICSNLSGDILTLKLSHLAIGITVINFDDPTITLYTGGILLDQSPSPFGTIEITQNSNNRISGTFTTKVNDIANTGQTIEITAGVFSNLAY